jgi:carbon-monoxide dehydrogenase large subunit
MNAPPAPAARAWTGRPLPRREDLRLLTGQGRFVADLAPRGTLRLDVLRSAHGPCRIRAVETASAAAMAGVRMVMTAADLAGLGRAAVNPLLPGARAVPMQPLAEGWIRAVGQPVAAVVAETAAAARDAVEAIGLDVDEEPGSDTDAPVLAHRWGSAVPAPPAGARVVTAAIAHALVAPAPLEPRAALAWRDGDRLTLHLSTQTPQRCRDDIAAVLGLPREAVRVIAPDVGGAFGGKASLMPEDVLVALAAWRLGSPVLWVATRSDDFLSATQGRGAATAGTAVVDRHGRLLSLTAELDFPLGHWMPYSALAPVNNAGRILPGPYDVPATEVRARARMTPGAAVNIYRGAGRPEAAILMERLMDKAAAALGLDPLAIRRRNVVARDAMPHAHASGAMLCSGDPAALLDRLAAAADYGGRCAARARRRAAGAVCGVGVALYVEPCGQGWETAEAALMPDGRVRIATGSSAQGQGRETAVAQIAADALGLPPERIDVVAGDSDVLGEAIGALASRSTAIGGSAVCRAAEALAGRAAAEVARLLGCAEGAVRRSGGGFSAGGGAQAVGWTDLARALDGGRGAPVLRVALRYDAPAEAWASGAVLAEVAVDRDTGAVTVERLTWADDAGGVVNPVLAEGQLVGGAAQGIGAALIERLVYRDGQLVTGSLMDYALPRAADMPPLRILSCPVPSPANALGLKGVGEAGCIGVPAAILNAVQDALSPFTDADLSLPLTPERLWRAMNGMEP